MLRRSFLALLGGVTAASVVPWPVRRFASQVASRVARPGEVITIVVADGFKRRTVTWNKEFKLAGPFSPAAGRRQTVQFIRDRAGQWIEVSRT